MVSGTGAVEEEWTSGVVPGACTVATGAGAFGATVTCCCGGGVGGGAGGVGDLYSGASGMGRAGGTNFSAVAKETALKAPNRTAKDSFLHPSVLFIESRNEHSR